ncbi:hypothetical protein V6N13_140572 [Hibiscus sabdariffa]
MQKQKLLLGKKENTTSAINFFLRLNRLPHPHILKTLLLYCRRQSPAFNLSSLIFLPLLPFILICFQAFSRSNTNPQNAVSETLKVSEALVFLNPSVSRASLTIVQWEPSLDSIFILHRFLQGKSK